MDNFKIIFEFNLTPITMKNQILLGIMMGIFFLSCGKEEENQSNGEIVRVSIGTLVFNIIDQEQSWFKMSEEDEGSFINLVVEGDEGTVNVEIKLLYHHVGLYQVNQSLLEFSIRHRESETCKRAEMSDFISLLVKINRITDEWVSGQGQGTFPCFTSPFVSTNIPVEVSFYVKIE